MFGLPFWGKETFSDIRKIKDLQYKVLTLDKIKELLKTKGIKYHCQEVNDVFSLFLSLAELNFLFVFEESLTYLTWCGDIQFNYRDTGKGRSSNFTRRYRKLNGLYN